MLQPEPKLVMNKTFIHHKLVEQALNDAQLVNCKFKFLTLESSIITALNIQDCNIEHLNLNETHIDTSTITGNFENPAIRGGTVNLTRFIGVTLSRGVITERTIFTTCGFRNVVFNFCNLSNVRFENCTFHNVVFFGCHFSGVSSPERPHLDHKVIFNKCITAGLIFESCKFPERTRLNTASRIGTTPHCVSFKQTLLIGAKFKNCDIKGIKKSDIAESTIEYNNKNDSASIQTVPNDDTHDPFIVDADYEVIGPTTTPKEEPSTESHSEDDDYDNEMSQEEYYDMMCGMTAWNEWRNQKSEPEVKYPYRFFSAGLK